MNTAIGIDTSIRRVKHRGGIGRDGQNCEYSIQSGFIDRDEQLNIIQPSLNVCEMMGSVTLTRFNNFSQSFNYTIGYYTL